MRLLAKSDPVAAGLPKAMLLCTHLSGEEAGMDKYATWLRTIITEVPVEYIPAGDQFYLPPNPGGN